MNDINDIHELQRKRFEFLTAVYNKTKNNQGSFEGMYLLGNGLGFDTTLTEHVVEYLLAEELIESGGIDGELGQVIRISHRGIIEVEAAMTHPDKGTEHFSINVTQNVTQVGSMVNSQIQQASPGATQTLTINESDRKELEEIIQSLKDHIDELGLKPQDKNDLEADIGTIQSQISSSKPKSSIIRDSLSSIKDFIVSVSANVAGSVIATDLLSNLLSKITALLAKLFGG